MLERVPGARRLHTAALAARWSARRLRGALRAAWSPRAISAYVSQQRIHKLHLGCGDNLLAGWLNADYYPADPRAVHLDATKVFPVGDKSFDYVFSEHMIEHIGHADGLRMLRQCHRVLRQGGRLRISTPDLGFLVALYSGGKSELQQNYIRWASDTFIHNREYTATMVINNFVRDWGHRFIYDEKTLRRSLDVSGFVDVVAHRINESQDPELRDLENEQRMPPGFLQLETFTLEARKA